MAKYPSVVSKDGRVTRVVTSQDELDLVKAQGYGPAKKTTASRDAIDSGAEGNQKARASSTTEGSETNTGSTTPPVK